MPTIELIKRRTNKQRNYQPVDESANRWAKDCYNTDRWRRIRQAYLMSNPLCELCNAMGITKAAVEVHHCNEISNAASKWEARDIAFDSNNLMSLCRECHNWYHAIRHGRHMTPDDKHKMEVYRSLVNKHMEQC